MKNERQSKIPNNIARYAIMETHAATKEGYSFSDVDDSLLYPLIEGLIKNPSPTWTQERETILLVASATAFPWNSEPLQGILPLLGETLVQTEESEEALKKQLRAYIFADSLLYQATLPLFEKQLFRTALGLKLESKDDLARKFEEITQPDAAAAESVISPESFSQSVDMFTTKLERLAHPAQTLQETTIQIRFLDAVFNHMRQNRFLAFWREFGNPNSIESLKKLALRIGANLHDSPYIEEALVGGSVDDVDAVFLSLIWSAAWEQKANRQLALGKKEDYTDLVQGFYRHPQVRQEFWKDFLMYPAVDIPQPQSDGIIVHKTPHHYAIIRDFLQYNIDFLETIPFESLDSKEHRATIRKLIGIIGLVKSLDAELPVFQNIVEAIRTASAGLGLNHSFTNELAILEDKALGILTLDEDQEARAQMPLSGQAKDDFLEKEKKKKRAVAYISKALWPQPEEQQHEDQKLLVAGENTSSPWAELVLPNPDDVPKVLNFLSQKLGVNEDDAFSIFDAYQNRVPKNHTAPLVVVPDIYPYSRYTQPLIQALCRIGVVIIDQQDDQVGFVIDGSKIGIETDGQKPIALKGKLNSQKELEIEGASLDFAYSPLHLLLNAAALLGRESFLESELSKEELQQVRGHVKSWNERSKHNGWPKVEFIQDPTKRPAGAKHILLPVGKKTTVLTTKRMLIQSL